jgi:hypothetical protein
MTTGIGSLPFKDPQKACEFVVNAVDIPFWPQLPKRSFYEFMIPQYSEGLPFIVIEEDNFWIERGPDEELTSFYEAVGQGKNFPVSADRAAGFYAFRDYLKENDKKFPIIKGHITGPLTFTLGLTDKGRKPLYFDEELRELSLELLKGKVRWQIKELKPFAEKVLIFIDEPVLSALGTSTYVGVSNEEALRLLRTIVSSIQEEEALAGMHCCSNADWSMVISSGVDILNFDAFDYADSIHLYIEDVKRFLNDRRFIAWGVIPTTVAIRSVTAESVREKLENEFKILDNMGISHETLIEHSLLTPSCGTGSMSEEDSVRVFTLLKELKGLYVS